MRSRAEKRAVGKRMLITLSGYVSPSGVGGGGYSPKCQERVIELGRMGVEMLLPNTRASDKESGTRDEQQVQ